MKRHTEYIIEENVAIALKKIVGKMNDTEYKEDYGLSESEILLVHQFFSLIMKVEE